MLRAIHFLKLHCFGERIKLKYLYNCWYIKFSYNLDKLGRTLTGLYLPYSFISFLCTGTTSSVPKCISTPLNQYWHPKNEQIFKNITNFFLTLINLITAHSSYLIIWLMFKYTWKLTLFKTVIEAFTYVISKKVSI